jgi:predicted aspartyl protease
VNERRVISDRPPRIPIRLIIEGQPGALDLDALIDTGFDGQVLLPSVLISPAVAALGVFDWRLADGSGVRTPLFTGDLYIGNLAAGPVIIAVLGNEILIGRGVTERFTVTFDHDRRVIVEP